MTPSWDTREYLERWHAGDRGAANELFEHYTQDLKHLVRWRLPRWANDQVDDLVQEALTNAYQALSAFEYRRKLSLRFWLRGIQSNAVNRWYEKNSRECHDRLQSSSGLHPAAQAEEGAGLQGLEERALEDERLEACLERLDPKKREAFLLRFRLTFQEIAQCLGFPTEDAARMAATRAQEQVAAWLADGIPLPVRSSATQDLQRAAARLVDLEPESQAVQETRQRLADLELRALRILASVRHPGHALEPAVDFATEPQAAEMPFSDEERAQRRRILFDLALQGIESPQVDALVMRLEAGVSYEQVAVECQLQDKNVARAAAVRAAVQATQRLASLLHKGASA